MQIIDSYSFITSFDIHLLNQHLLNLPAKLHSGNYDRDHFKLNHQSQNKTHFSAKLIKQNTLLILKRTKNTDFK